MQVACFLQSICVSKESIPAIPVYSHFSFMRIVCRKSRHKEASEKQHLSDQRCLLFVLIVTDHVPDSVWISMQKFSFASIENLPVSWRRLYKFYVETV